MRIQDERNGESIKSSPHSRIHSGMCTSLFFKQRMVTRPLRVGCFSNISQESCQRNCSLYRVAGCRRTKGAGELNGA
jgi:hypothetical protein